MRARTIIAGVGYGLVGLIIAGLVLTVALALKAQHPYYGRNAYGLSLETYSTAAILVIAGVVGAIRLLQMYRSRKRRRSAGG